MSGQRNNTQAEANKKRNEYMETLDLMDEINDMNLQANKNYLATGMLPAVSQIKDTRTTAEKLLDIEKMKQNVVADLKGLYEPSVAMEIANGILKSPLNVDNKLFRFFVQNLPEMAKRLKLKFKYGISGDANDIEQVIEIIQGFYAQSVETLVSAKSYFDSGSSYDSKKSLMKKSDFSTLKTFLLSIQKSLVGVRGGVEDNQDRDLNRLINLVNLLTTNLPSDELMNESALVSLNNPNDFMNDTDLILMSQLVRKIPPLYVISVNIKNLEKAVDNGDMRMVDEVLKNMIKVIEPLVNELTKLNPQFAQANQNLINKNRDAKIAEREKIKEDQMARNSVLNAQNVNIVGQPINVRPYDPATFGAQPGAIAGPPPLIAPNLPIPLTRDQMEQIATNINNDPRYRHPEFLNEMGYSQVIDAMQKENVKRLNDRELYEAIHKILQITHLPTGIVAGYGLKKRRGRPKGSGIIREKPKSVKVPNYTDFGTNEINQKSLKNNILTIRRKNRSNYADMPSRMISPIFKNVVHKIIGGSVPSYNDIKGLNEEEQNYLHKLLSKSNIDDKFSVPTPSKDKREKDINDFEVMKGEIMSGNDSRELVKKFKILILRLSREGSLPKNEVNELLTTLVELGY